MTNRGSGGLMHKILIGSLIAVTGAIWGAIITRETDPMEELHDSRNTHAWRSRIEATTCRHCGAINESHEDICFRCGQNLAGPNSAPLSKMRHKNEPVGFEAAIWPWVVLVIVFLLIVLFFLST